MDASTTESHVRTTDRSGAPLGTFRADSCASSSPLRITVLAGGPSAERAVSLESGRAVHAALSRLGHRCALRDVVPDDLSALEEPTDFVFIALHGAFGEDGTIQSELDRRVPLRRGPCGTMACRGLQPARRFLFPEGALNNNLNNLKWT